ncbi:MAG: autotransporter assembly complex family protein [Pseudobdellovibrionaceae bacterium]|nr:autotransporter assembly complex family protein [Pseudobdellovibrionaceae bacterium]
MSDKETPNKKELRLPVKTARLLIGGIALGALSLGTFISQSYAEIGINIEGLSSEKDNDLDTYIKEIIIPRYEQEKPSRVNIEAVRQDALDALYAKGYYDAEVVVEHDKKNVNLDISAHKIYKIGRISIKGATADLKSLEVKQGEILDATQVLAAQKKLYAQIAKDSCFYSLNVTHEVTLNKAANTGDVTFLVTTGPKVAFGKTEFTGAKSVDRDYLAHFIKYKEGECWDATKIEKSKAELIENGLLSLVQVKYPETPPPSNSAVPLVFELKERAPRSVRLGASLYTDEGIGVVAKWTHRNFFGAGENVTFDTSLSLLRQSIGVDFSKPYFLRDDQSLSLAGRLKNEDSDAYVETGIESAVSLKRQINSHLNIGLGVGVDISRLEDKNTQETNTYGLLSFPMAANYDNRDNILDPHRGWAGVLSVEPFLDVMGESSPFVKTRLTTSTYLKPLSRENAPILALRGSIGSILGSGTDTIPASKRFFAGGGNSIRGFGYQKVGPYDDDGDPAGGRSIIETSAELRIKFSQTLGGVAFVDAGNVYDAVVPDLKGGVYVGAGLGVRYYTDFAPIRFDVALPMNKKGNLDQNFQIYISIGQAF